jgi:predicted dehydrogenase
MENAKKKGHAGRREVLKAAGAGLTTSLFSGRMRGANDRITLAFLGVGGMGNYNLTLAMRQPQVAVVGLCDVYQTNLERSVATAIAGGHQPKAVKDFREVLADKSVDAVCICTPDHWHALMTVEACKAGKDVWVEKPVCATVEEGRKMVLAARKYSRVVQSGTMQRSGDVFQKATELIRSGRLGKITFCRTWNYGLMDEKGMGNPPDSDPPPGLDWDMWLGPAPLRPYNKNRCMFNFRWFWDYAGGMMTDWGVHWMDIVQMAFNETMPAAITALGGIYYLKDNRETPDTLLVTYEYPGFLATYEWRAGNAESMFKQGGGILFHGTRGTLFVTRNLYKVTPEKGSDLEPVEEQRINDAHLAHWANFLECIRTRQKPVSDIETGYRSTATCLLGNAALRSRMRVAWDPHKETTLQGEARPYLTREYRAPWKLAV